MTESFVTKDSGKRVDFDSGMRRDTDEGKPRYDLIDRPMLRRWADLMARGAEKYGEDNWRLANSDAEARRFKASAFRHFMQWQNGERDEDHAAAVLFNIAAYEFVRAKLEVAEPARGGGMAFEFSSDLTCEDCDVPLSECLCFARERAGTGETSTAPSGEESD